MKRLNGKFKMHGFDWNFTCTVSSLQIHWLKIFTMWLECWSTFCEIPFIVVDFLVGLSKIVKPLIFLHPG